MAQHNARTLEASAVGGDRQSLARKKRKFIYRQRHGVYSTLKTSQPFHFGAITSFMLGCPGPGASQGHRSMWDLDFDISKNGFIAPGTDTKRSSSERLNRLRLLVLQRSSSNSYGCTIMFNTVQQSTLSAEALVSAVPCVVGRHAIRVQLRPLPMYPFPSPPHSTLFSLHPLE